jgi:hypothetical protein
MIRAGAITVDNVGIILDIISTSALMLFGWSNNDMIISVTLRKNIKLITTKHHVIDGRSSA